MELLSREHLPAMWEVLGWIPSTTKRKQRRLSSGPGTHSFHLILPSTPFTPRRLPHLTAERPEKGFIVGQGLGPSDGLWEQHGWTQDVGTQGMHLSDTDLHRQTASRHRWSSCPARPERWYWPALPVPGPQGPLWGRRKPQSSAHIAPWSASGQADTQ